MIKGIITDAFGEILETGKATVQQAKKQIGPQKIVQSAMEQVGIGNQIGGNQAPPGLEDLKQAKKTPQQLTQLKQQSAVKSKQQLDSTRININRMIRQRYAEMQGKIQQEEVKREQEPIQKQQQEMMEMQKKQQEEEKKAQPIQTPSLHKAGKGKKGGFKITHFIRQKLGSAEVKGSKLG